MMMSKRELFSLAGRVAVGTWLSAGAFGAVGCGTDSGDAGSGDTGSGDTGSGDTDSAGASGGLGDAGPGAAGPSFSCPLFSGSSTRTCSSQSGCCYRHVSADTLTINCEAADVPEKDKRCLGISDVAGSVVEMNCHGNTKCQGATYSGTVVMNCGALEGGLCVCGRLSDGVGTCVMNCNGTVTSRTSGQAHLCP